VVDFRLVIPAIRAENVVKRFGAITAVDGLSLTVQPGTCLGLLGPNGAGKSTTMRMLTGQAHATSGTIDVLGLRIPDQGKQARARMGVVPQSDNLDEQLTCRANLCAWAAMYRIPRDDRAAAVDRALSVATLSERADSVVNDLSGGMRRRLLIARGLIHSPELVLLDEPTVGLDPQIRAELWTLIDQLRNDGVTVLMSTHYIEEAERLADDVAIMNHGRIIAQGAPETLLAAHAGSQAAEFYGSPARLREIEAAAAAHRVSTRRTGPSVSLLRAESLPATFLARYDDYVMRASNLEDVFVLLTGEDLE
jgi:lipooligosaccharide transport system ATP-binding protein